MQLPLIVVSFLSCVLGLPPGDAPPALSVLYLGNASKPRAQEFAAFFEKTFSRFKVVNRDDLDPKTAVDYDVVLLDWSQRDVDLSDMGGIRSPLGPRASWNRPTVLLGSAGLLIASPWRTTGSSG